MESVLRCLKLRQKSETPVILRDILQNIWTERNAPASWIKGTIIKLPKKGDLGDCGSWRGITTAPFCLLQAKPFAESFLNASHLMWTISPVKSKQVPEKEDHALTTFLPCDRY
ncbi:hypothetical protein ElyMa_004607500 [Elysia marginata]|uniref:Uncharacterized protein n=1 Tax=Elysia marginata TaxID=1093978 RepID=A0AAV4HXQ4_9GAST|nr:hypothetical protein ElyMa_004607500 [Elysia marginata]